MRKTPQSRTRHRLGHDLRQVVPNRARVLEVSLAALGTSVPGQGALLVLGPGSPDGLLRVARALPGWTIDALEPCDPLYAASVRRVEEAGLSHRVVVTKSPLTAVRQPRWDAAVSVSTRAPPDEAARAEHWRRLGTALRPGGALIHAEMEAVTDADLADWHKGDDRGEAGGAERLTCLFRSPSRSSAWAADTRTPRLALAGGFRHQRALFRGLGVTVDLWRRAASSGRRMREY